MACCACCCGGEDCTEGQEGKCCCGGSTGTCCQEGEYCCDGVCEDVPCVCSEDTLGEPCGDEPYDPDVGYGYICCYNNNAELGCFGFPQDVYGCDEEEYCAACGAAGGIETRIGPYASSFAAAVAAAAWFAENCESGSTADLSCDGGTTHYGFICCTDEAP